MRGDESVATEPLIVVTEQTFDFPIEVMIWNYLDGEHLEFVHKGYKSPNVLVLHGDVSLFTSHLKVPLLPIFFKATNLVFLPNYGTQVTVTTTTFAIIRTTIEITSTESGGSTVRTEYAWFLPRLLRPLKRIIKRLILKWNTTVNLEDAPLRTRRTLVLSKGFRDFHGMPMSATPGQRSITLPYRLPSDSPVFSGPFTIRSTRRVRLNGSAKTIELTEQ